MLATAITSRLSMNDVLGRGRFVKFDTDDLLAIGDMHDVLVEPEVPNYEEVPS
jgi:hypothetical protein